MKKFAALLLSGLLLFSLLSCERIPVPDPVDPNGSVVTTPTVNPTKPDPGSPNRPNPPLKTEDTLPDIPVPPIPEEQNSLAFALNPDGKSYAVVGMGTCKDESIVVPAEYRGLPVTHIGKDAFQWCDRTFDITLPDSIVCIEEYAFSDCFHLMNVVFGKGLKIIRNNAFLGCARLTHITIPENVELIEEKAFYGCMNLVEVCNCSATNFSFELDCYGYFGVSVLNIYTPDSGSSKLTDSNGYTFYQDKYNCYLVGYPPHQSKLVLPQAYNGMPYTIHNDLFYFDSEIKQVILPDWLKSIGQGVFALTGITSITLPDSVEVIERYAFYNCIELIDVQFGEHIKNIGSYAFSSCFKLDNIVLPDSFEDLADRAFEDCFNLKNIFLGNNLFSIGYHAFYRCESLTYIILPYSIHRIESCAFEGCKNLYMIFYCGADYLWFLVNKDSDWDKTLSYKLYFVTTPTES